MVADDVTGDGADGGGVDLEVLGRFLEVVDLLTPHAVRAAVSLGVPRLIDEGVVTVAGLAAETGVDAAALASLLEVLGERALVSRDADGRYGLSELGALMLHPDAVFALDTSGVSAAMDEAWAGLHHALRTGEPGYPVVHGRGFWDHLESDAALGADFDEYMRRNSLWTPAAAASDVWPVTGVVVDVGGGDGRLLADVLHERPALRGVLVEQPATAARARVRFDELGLAGRVEVVEGSFFDELPTGGDLYVLGQVLHDWPRAQAVEILGRTAEAAGVDGRVLLVEQVLDRDALSSFQARVDLLMRVLFASHERTAGEWEALAAAAGLSVVTLHPCDGVRMLIELRGGR